MIQLKLKYPLVVVLTIVMMSFGNVRHLLAQDYIPIFSQDYSARLSVEIDPASFIFSGYAIHLRYQPMFSERFLIGGGTYAFDLPEMFVNLNAANQHEGWKVRIKSAYSIFGELYLEKANQGWFLGEQIGFQNFKVSNAKEAGGSTRFSNILFMTYLGYSWHPYKGAFYIKPWAGLGITNKVDGTSQLGDRKFDISPLFPFITFHVGYTF